jgi:hypothetical protein
VQKAIAKWRRIWPLLQQMQVISRTVSCGTLPDTRRRKRLTKKLLGLI